MAKVLLARAHEFGVFGIRLKRLGASGVGSWAMDRDKTGGSSCGLGSWRHSCLLFITLLGANKLG